MLHLGYHKSPSRQSGFTIIEAMISLVILTFGLLGVGSMVMKGLTMNHSSYLRSLAMQQAYDFADRARGNTVGVTAGNYDTVTYTANQTCTPCTSAAVCTAAQMATYDKCYWNTQNETLLPLGRGTVTRSGAEFVITVSWDDNKSGAAGKSFVLRAQP